MNSLLQTVLVVILLGLSAGLLHAETGREAWLRYARLADAERAKYVSLPASAVAIGDSELVRTAQKELVRGFRGMMGRTLGEVKELPQENIFVLGTIDRVHAVAPTLQPTGLLVPDGYWLTNAKIKGHGIVVITAANDRGVLYGVFALLSKMARNENLSALNEVQQPYAPIRWVDQWDNLNGTIERGYAGPSIFFADNDVRADLTRADEYARLLASVGINGCAVNNVNSNPRVLDESFLPQLARIANVFRRWGIRLSISVDVSSPKAIGKLDSFDPLDPQVAEWWKKS